jgi:hypothetical protein
VTDHDTSAPRKPYSFRLSDQEVDMLRKRDSNLSRAIRRLIHGPEPEPQPTMPLIGDSLAMGGRVFFTDASGTYEIAPTEARLTSATWPPIPTYNGPVNTLFEVVR